MLSFENWENGYAYFHNGNQVAAGLYGDGGFELLENDSVQNFSNGMQAFCYLKAKYESNSSPLKQSTIDLFTPGKGSNFEGERGRYIIAAGVDPRS